DGDREAERTVRYAGRLRPGGPEVGAPEGPEAGVRVRAEGGVAADRDDRAAVRRRPADVRDDLARQAVADRAPGGALVAREPEAAGSLGCEQPVGRSVVGEPVEARRQLVQPEAVDVRVVR